MATLKAFQIFSFAAQAAIPCGGVTVSEWADAERILSPEASAEPGKWRTSRVPYAREWMDICNDPRVQEIYLMTSSQVAKSETLNNICGYFIKNDPCPIMLIQPTVDRMKDYSKKRIAPMIRDTPTLAAVVSDEATRNADNTTLSKSFVGGHLLMTGANAASALASNPIRVVLADEIDRYPNDVDNEGDPLSLARVRTRTFTNRKIIGTSTPTIKGDSRIEDEFNRGDKRRYFVPCPHCQEYQLLEWDRIVFEREKGESLGIDDKTGEEKFVYGKAIKATYACINGCDIEEYNKLRMLEAGEWRGEQEHTGIVSFHINALYSVWYSWTEAANDFITASAEAKNGKPEKLKVFVNTTLGETWDTSKETADITGLENRAANDGEYFAEVPLGVLCLTAGIDVQPSRLECHVVGWGADLEAWSINYYIIQGDPEKAQVWQELKEVLLKDFECEREDADGNRLTRTIDAACIDSGGHNTQAVYNFCRLNKGYNWIPIKGSSTGQSDIITQRPTKLQGGLLLYSVGTTVAKNTLFGSLKLTEQGAGYFHFPVGYDTEFYLQMTSEKKIKKVKKFDKKDPHGYSEYVYKKIRERNEVLDCTVYALAGIKFLTPDFTALLAQENIACAPRPQIIIDEMPKRKTGFTSRFGTNKGGFVSAYGSRK